VAVVLTRAAYVVGFRRIIGERDVHVTLTRVPANGTVSADDRTAGVKSVVGKRRARP